MSRLKSCRVYLSDGRVIEDTTVLFRENGWIRIGSRDEEYTYRPPHTVQAVSFDPEESE